MPVETMATKKHVELLENRLSLNDFVRMQSLFLPQDSDKPLFMTRVEFVERAWSTVGRGAPDEYGRLFDSVDVSRVGRIDWCQLTSYLLLWLSEKDEHGRAALVPRWSPLRTLPPVHRGSIQQVAYLRASNRFLSISKEGMFAVWTDRLELLKSQRLATDSVKPRDLWVTGMAVMANVHKIAVSFTSKEICIFDLLSKQELGCQYKLYGLEQTPIWLDYWHNPSDPDEAVLSFGDVGGQVRAICFTSAQISLFEKPSGGTEQDALLVLSWAEVAQGSHRCCYAVHHRAHGQDWVRRVKFLGNLEAFVSCSTAAENSLVLAWREKEAVPLRVTTFHNAKGTNDLDYHAGINLIATACVDGMVRLWNPYVISKPVGLLQGHKGVVMGVCFIHGKKQLLSFSIDMVLKVWDIHHQLCIQQVGGIFPKTQECWTLLLYHEDRGQLFLTFNSVMTVLECRLEETRKTTSHEQAVTCVLYNSFLKQVISCDAGSTIIFWLVDTGQKVKQFTRCHGDSEICAMALDGTQTRLFTGATDGLVKVWDFNGHCHHKMNAGCDRAVEISQILVLKHTVLVVGWERMITVFRPSTFSQLDVQPSKWKGAVQHQDDVLCAAFHSPQTLVTGGIDGEIVVWNNITESPLRRLWRDGSTTITSQSGAPALSAILSGQDKVECRTAVTRLFFLEGRKSAAAAGGADLVSCGGSGAVQFWNTSRGCLVGEFVAHLGASAIVMTVDISGVYLVTADMDGVVKMWRIQDYCLTPGKATEPQAPPLLSRIRPHSDCVTHLETCAHNGHLFLLSASADCRLVLSHLPGKSVGVFGQENQWHFKTPGETPLPSSTHPQEQEGSASFKEGADASLQLENNLKDMEREPERTLSLEMESVAVESSQNWMHPNPLTRSILKKSYEKRRDRWVRKSKRPLREGTQSCAGIFRRLNIEELEPVRNINKPSLITTPRRHFWDSPTELHAKKN